MKKLLLVLLVPSFVGAYIQPYSIPTEEALKHNVQPYSMPTEAVYALLRGYKPQGLTLEQEQVLSTIKSKCLNFNVNCDTAIRIAKAESNFKNVPNYLYTDEKGRYTAYGIFQILRSTYKTFCGNPDERMIIEKNIECGLKIMQDSGVQHWSESLAMWSS